MRACNPPDLGVTWGKQMSAVGQRESIIQATGVRLPAVNHRCPVVAVDFGVPPH